MRAILALALVGGGLACSPVENTCELVPGAIIAPHPSHSGFCPSDCTDPAMTGPNDCVDDTGSPVCRDEGHEGDACGDTSFEGTHFGNVITWCGPGPLDTDTVNELRWDYCPCFLDADGRPKMPGWSPVGNYEDCVPDGCQNITFTAAECDTPNKKCARCDNSGSTNKLIECDYHFADYVDPTHVGYYRVTPGGC